ncbi:relaxase/mobilization nuclease domain-containing protein [Yersinia enterocolitica]|uniref:relaxase/mobilization nuclease domain-containing protein n=1 Tax=Yersinia enterocolitica TaxID=630 RepID=UPI001C675F53|nr:relaxase/mobilization nuclease domain-containing protein [Yersinia enterocolitica]MBW5869620.1 relaxase/mobilization nuclease domain-containing protein [Yersinia enterocolitica]
MKGMQRIKRHKNFINVVKYVLKPGSHHKSDPTIIGGNMTGAYSKELIAEFDIASELRTDIAKPGWHNSLRLPKNDEITNEQWKLIADDYMNQMGFSDTHLRCYVLHDDSAGQHIHIIANRVDAVSGKVHLGRHESLKSGRTIQALEIRYGLTITKGPESLKPENVGKGKNGSTSIKAKKISRNESMLEQRTGDICNKKRLQIFLDKSLSDKPDLLTFIKRLENSEVAWIANIASTGKMNGFSFEYAGIAFKASQLGKSYSWVNLQKRLNYNPEHLQGLRSSISTKEAPAPAPAPAPAEIAIKVTKESLTISEKIASLTPSPSHAPSITASVAPASKTVVKEDKRQRILSAVLDLQNSQRRRNATVARFNSWLIVIKLLKKIGFSVLYPVRQFKNIFTVHSFLPPAGSKFTASLKQQR